MSKEQDAGIPTAELRHMHGHCAEGFYKFKTKYGGRNVFETHRLKSLEDEKAKAFPVYVEAYPASQK